ncbi:MAG: succinyl-diaminopimelate desuccinylase [Sulfuricurvum sp. PC08-66]|nr:MAG: succinyl-diaminopimelate desuccinylase [Sulfuricurvum sp. PC08-66]
MSVVALTKKLIQMPSVTPNDGGILAYVVSLLPDFTPLWLEKNEVKNLFLYRRFGEGEHLCFAGHVDVVPAGQGWGTPPFEAVEKEGYLYGRGAQDMKGGVAAFVQALIDTTHFAGTLSLLLTSDEEGAAIDGTLAMLEELKVQGLLPDCAVVAEPTCEVRMGDAIKVGRRGSINATLTILGKQGHAAYPEKVTNPLDILAPKLTQLSGYRLDEGDEFFAPSQIVITDIRGGMQVTNVTPDSVTIMFNVRNNTLTSVTSIEAHIATLFAPHQYRLEIAPSSRAFVTSREAKIVTQMAASIAQACRISPVFSTAGGTSDARYFAQYGIDVVEFGVLNDRIHKIDERTSLEELHLLYETFRHLIDHL